MKKHDYELIAAVIRQFDGETKEKLARLFIGQIPLANPKFNANKFLDLCGIETVEQHITKLNKSFKFGDS